MTAYSTIRTLALRAGLPPSEATAIANSTVEAAYKEAAEEIRETVHDDYSESQSWAMMRRLEGALSAASWLDPGETP